VTESHHHHKHHHEYSLNVQNLNDEAKPMSYFVGDEYQAKTASEKQNSIMAEVTRSKGDRGPWYSKVWTGFTLLIA
jgi:cation transport regulator ChaC